MTSCSDEPRPDDEGATRGAGLPATAPGRAVEEPVVSSGAAATLRRAWGQLRQRGPFGFGREVLHRWNERRHERRLGVATGRLVDAAALGYGTGDRLDYVPAPYGALHWMLRRLPVRKEESTFVDYGAGKGRAVFVAGTYPFRRVIGVECAPRLVEVAERNAVRMRGRRAGAVEFVLADATTYDLPDDANVLHFFNPFLGETLARVFDRIRASWERRSRPAAPLHVLYLNDDHFRRLLPRHPWIEEVARATLYRRLSCGIYRARTP